MYYKIISLFNISFSTLVLCLLLSRPACVQRPNGLAQRSSTEGKPPVVGSVFIDMRLKSRKHTQIYAIIVGSSWIISPVITST